MRALLIVNPHATSTTERRRDLLAHALAAEVNLVVQHTGGRGHAAELATAGIANGAELLVVHGGDGTVNEVANGIMARPAGTDPPLLGVLPGGSTNVFARAMGISPDPLTATEQILEALVTHQQPRSISLGQVDDRYFTFTAGLGLDAEVVQAVEERRAAGRRISNMLHVRKALTQYFRTDRRSGRLTFELPGEGPHNGVHLLIVSNVDPWTYLQQRPLRTNPGTSPDTGLGVFALTSMRFPAVIQIAGQLMFRRSRPSSGSLIARDDVDAISVRCSRPVGLQVDGDYVGERTTAEFRSVPDALRLIGGDHRGL